MVLTVMVTQASRKTMANFEFNSTPKMRIIRGARAMVGVA